jgi:hypothetical protein
MVKSLKKMKQKFNDRHVGQGGVSLSGNLGDILFSVGAKPAAFFGKDSLGVSFQLLYGVENFKGLYDLACTTRYHSYPTPDPEWVGLFGEKALFTPELTTTTDPQKSRGQITAQVPKRLLSHMVWQFFGNQSDCPLKFDTSSEVDILLNYEGSFDIDVNNTVKPNEVMLSLTIPKIKIGLSAKLVKQFQQENIELPLGAEANVVAAVNESGGINFVIPSATIRMIMQKGPVEGQGSKSIRFLPLNAHRYTNSNGLRFERLRDDMIFALNEGIPMRELYSRMLESIVYQYVGKFFHEKPFYLKNDQFNINIEDIRVVDQLLALTLSYDLPKVSLPGTSLKLADKTSEEPQAPKEMPIAELRRLGILMPLANDPEKYRDYMLDVFSKKSVSCASENIAGSVPFEGLRRLFYEYIKCSTTEGDLLELRWQFLANPTEGMVWPVNSVEFKSIKGQSSKIVAAMDAAVLAAKLGKPSASYKDASRLQLIWDFNDGKITGEAFCVSGKCVNEAPYTGYAFSVLQVVKI